MLWHRKTKRVAPRELYKIFNIPQPEVVDLEELFKALQAKGAIVLDGYNELWEWARRAHFDKTKTKENIDPDQYLDQLIKQRKLQMFQTQGKYILVLRRG